MIPSIRGLVGTPVTPFTRDDRIDASTLQKLVDFFIRHGVHALGLPTHMGESLNMSAEERKEVARLAVEATGGRVPILVHTSAAATDEVVALSRHAQSIGANGVVVVAPYYWQPPRPALVDHFVTVASALDISFVGYNSPEQVGVSLSVDLLMELIERCPNFVGLKDMTLNMEYFTEACRVTADARPGFSMFTGGEHLLTSMVVGGAGAFSGAIAVAPRLVRAVYDACVAKDYERARPLQYRLTQLVTTLRVGYPARFKAALEIMGRPSGHTRRPIQPLDSAAIIDLRTKLEKLGILSDEPHGW